MKKDKKRKCNSDKDKMLMARRLDTLKELDMVIETMAEELWELRMLRFNLRKVADGEKKKKG